MAGPGGRERIEETIGPVQTIARALEIYLKRGCGQERAYQRLLAIRIRSKLTDKRQKRGVEKGWEYAILTDEISKAWSGTTRHVQAVQGPEKREPAGQTKRPGTVAEHAG